VNTIEAAVRLLNEKGQPLSSKEIAVESIQRGWVVSTANNPEQSLANSLDKMIREKNTTILKHVKPANSSRKMIALADWDDSLLLDYNESIKEMKVFLSTEQSKLLSLMVSVGLVTSEKAALNVIIEKGINQILPVIEEKVNNTLSLFQQQPKK
jgi:hypothetical protein